MVVLYLTLIIQTFMKSLVVYEGNLDLTGFIDDESLRIAKKIKGVLDNK